MDEIPNNHLGCIKPCKWLDKLPTSIGAGFLPSTVWKQHVFSSIFLSNFTTTKLDLIDWKIRKSKNWIWEDLLLGFSTVGVRVFWIVSPVPHFLGIWLLPFQWIKQVDFRYSMSIRNWSGFGINHSNVEKTTSKCHLKGKKGAPVFFVHPPKKNEPQWGFLSQQVQTLGYNY